MVSLSLASPVTTIVAAVVWEVSLRLPAWSIRLRNVILSERVAEWRQSDVVATCVLGPVPGEIDGSRQLAKDGLALFGECVSVSVLVAHHDDSLTVDGKLSAQSSVSVLQLVNMGVQAVHSFSIFANHASVPVHLLVVGVELLVVISNMSVSSVHSILKARDRLSKSLSADKHVTGLSNLKLVSMLAEEGSVSVKGVDGFIEVRGSGVGWRGGSISTVVIVGCIIVIEVVIQVGEMLSILVHLGLLGERDGSEECGGKGFHFMLQLSLIY